MAEAIYRGWDRGRLDAELNLRARWPDHADIFQRWAADSRKLRERPGARIDLAYGPGEGERLDLFPVPDQTDAPLLAFIHGGYWQSLDKSDFSWLAPPWLARGVAFASLNYDLAPKATIPQMVAQVRRAVDWLSRHARAHGIDPGRIHLAGHSAGGHLAVMALDRAAPDAPETAPRGALSISGVYDLEPIRLSYHQAVLRLDPDQVADASPLRRVPRAAPPLLLAVGAEETEEFRRQQAEFLEVWRGQGLSGTTVDLPGRHHFTALDALGEPEHPLFAAMEAMIEETCRPRGA